MNSVPVIVIELFLFGGVAIGFALWDLRSLERERRKRQQQREEQQRVAQQPRDTSAGADVSSE